LASLDPTGGDYRTGVDPTVWRVFWLEPPAGLCWRHAPDEVDDEREDFVVTQDIALPRLRRPVNSLGGLDAERTLGELRLPTTPRLLDRQRGAIAAALHEIGALTLPRIAELTSYADRRAAHRALTRARPLLSASGCWPWACWTDGKPPPRWHSHADDESALTQLDDWRSGASVRSPASLGFHAGRKVMHRSH
jgi:hypothetical protein